MVQALTVNNVARVQYHQFEKTVAIPLTGFFCMTSLLTLGLTWVQMANRSKAMRRANGGQLARPAAAFTIAVSTIYGLGVLLLNHLLPDSAFFGGMRSLVSQLWAALIAIIIFVVYLCGGWKLARILPPAPAGGSGGSASSNKIRRAIETLVKTSRRVAAAVGVFVLSAGLVPVTEDTYGIGSVVVTILLYNGVMFGSITMMAWLVASFMAASTATKRGVKKRKSPVVATAEGGVSSGVGSGISGGGGGGGGGDGGSTIGGVTPSAANDKKPVKTKRQSIFVRALALPATWANAPTRHGQSECYTFDEDTAGTETGSRVSSSEEKHGDDGVDDDVEVQNPYAVRTVSNTSSRELVI